MMDHIIQPTNEPLRRHLGIPVDASKCPVHRTLTSDKVIRTEVLYEAILGRS